MLARTIQHNWVKHLVVGMLALVFVPLSGPMFFCKCNGQVVTMSQLKTSAECCATHCEDEPAQRENGCPKDPTAPCNEEVELVFAHPEGAGGQLKAEAPSPLEVLVPGDASPVLALAPLRPRAVALKSHPPPGSGRLHLHFQILLI